jgi:tetratricopeptide (TPR) repeat protein
MSSPNDPVQPIPFDVVQPAPSPTSETRTVDAAVHRGTPVWVLPALGGLLLLAALVIFWLPASLEPAPPGPAPTAAESAGANTTGQADTAAAKATTATTDAAPYSDAQAARLRKEAQEKAAELLDLQFALKERGAEQWARAPFAEVATVATEGDALYKSRQYEPATARYQQGLTALQALQESIPQVLKRLLEQAQQAIDKGDAPAAQTALAMAAVIEPDNSDIAALQRRAEVLPQLLPLLEGAVTAEAAGDLSQAQRLLQEATALDPLHQRAQTELQRIATKLRKEGFNEAMSAGYAALNEGHFDSARKAFRNAATLQQGSSEAASALREVETAATAQRLASLNKQGQQDERQEQWQKAVEAYEQAQKYDSSVLFASDGLKRSRARAQLDQQFRKVIEEPQRLSDAGVAAGAAQLLAQAKQITPRGPVLEQQIRQLDTLLRQANATVAVTLRSDQETEVLVYKVAKLGRFAEQELTLRPGTYTALGTRNGYRDVRRSFTIAHDSNPAPVTIVCTEPI